MTQTNWINNDFMLHGEAAITLYNNYAKDMPIVDFHNHLSPEEIITNKPFKNITEAWLKFDHYKWRLMRAYGIDEYYITGDALPEEKFMKWAEVVPHTFGNPIFHWTHLELKRYFGIDELLTPATATSIYAQCNELLRTEPYTPQALLKRMNVEVLCTTDDPTDTLEFHRKGLTKLDIKMLPSWRPDKVLLVHDINTWHGYLHKLSACTGIDITNYAALKQALRQRVELFLSVGCRVADIGITRLPGEIASEEETEHLFQRHMHRGALTFAEIEKLQFGLLKMLCKLNHDYDLVQQLHIGPMRNVNTRLYSKLGADCGGDSMSDFEVAQPLARLLGELDSEGHLAPTILYNLNPKDGDVMATLAYNFNDYSMKGKMQYGAAWWFLDTLQGMTKQLDTISQYGLLSQFVGMLTDSRSLLSFTRHEYFRRILCNYIGNMVDTGLLPQCMLPELGKAVQNICYNNAKAYFRF
ncbi:MAG: glucuronate isomerase [Marinifilaceae bacterium]